MINLSSKGLQNINTTVQASKASKPSNSNMTDSVTAPKSTVVSAITGAVDSIFGTIGSAIKGKTKRDLMRQQGNQQLVQNAVDLHSQRLQNAQPRTKSKNYTPMIILGLVAVLVFTILVFTLKKP